MAEGGPLDWGDEPPTWQEVTTLCIRRINEKLARARLRPLSSRTLNLLDNCATEKETFYILHDAADGPLENINKRICHRVGKQERLVRGGRWNENNSEEDLSSDDSQVYHTPRQASDALRPLRWPLSYRDVTSSSESDSDMAAAPVTGDAV
jgi:hypothetical protein